MPQRNLPQTQLDQNLFDASAAGDLEDARLAIAAGANVNAKGEDGWTALHFAAHTGDGAVVALLIDAGADLHAQIRPDGLTPLDLAHDMLNDATIPVLKDAVRQQPQRESHADRVTKGRPDKGSRQV